MPKHQSTVKIGLRKTKKSLLSLGMFIRKHSMRSLGILVGIILIIGGGILIYKTADNSQFLIQSVSIIGDDYSKLYKHKLSSYLQKDFTGMSRVMLPWYQMKFGKYYRTHHRRIKEIQFKKSGKNLIITIHGHKPQLLMSVSDGGTVALLENISEPILMNKLPVFGSGERIPIVQLIVNQKGIHDNGYKNIFRDLSAKTLIHQVTLIDENIQGYEGLSWAPGSHKLGMSRTDGKVFFFDLTKNMIEQLNIYKRITTGSGNILSHYQIIDIGTMDSMIFLK